MKTIDIIAACAKNPELPFLIIGGFAVVAHGYPRETVDLDYLVLQPHRDAWQRVFRGLGYQPTHEHENFVQYVSERGGIDLDLMFVKPPTFEAMFAASRVRSFGPTEARVVSLEHLIALKLHVIKQDIRHRVLGDMDDVINLLLANRVDLRQESWRQLFLKYGDLELYEKIARAIAP
jgi:hypothetical protein